jgi:hypothetical protein
MTQAFGDLTNELMKNIAALKISGYASRYSKLKIIQE